MIFGVVGLIFSFVIFGVGSFLLNHEKNKKKYFRVYISGPMTGYENFNFPAFKSLEKKILDNFKNVVVVNPVDISLKVESIKPTATYEDYLREDFRELIDCDAVVFLDGWKKSGGCLKELTIANYLEIKCFENYTEFENFLKDKKDGCKN